MVSSRDSRVPSVRLSLAYLRMMNAEKERDPTPKRMQMPIVIALSRLSRMMDKLLAEHPAQVTAGAVLSEDISEKEREQFNK